MTEAVNDWDWAAFQKQYWPLLVGHARQWLSVYRKLAMEPEDVAQETLQRACAALASLRTKENPRAWLLHVQKNVVKDLWKKARRRVSYSSLDLEEFDPRADRVDPADDWIDPLHWLAPHVQDLPDSAGNLLRAGYKLGSFEDEILARELDRTPGGVRSEISKIRHALLDSFGWGEWMLTLSAHRYCVGLRQNKTASPGSEPIPIFRPLLPAALWHDTALSYANSTAATRESIWLSEYRIVKHILARESEGRCDRLLRELADVAAYNWALLGEADLEDRLVCAIDRHAVSVQRLAESFGTYYDQGLITLGEVKQMVEVDGERYLNRVAFLVERLEAVRSRKPAQP